MGFTVSETALSGVILVHSDIFEDNRGFFRETYSLKSYLEHNLPVHFNQDNISFSKKGVIRGLHYQVKPFTQGKLITCVKGKIIDIAVDLRLKSETFLEYISSELNENDGNSLYIPEGFAHGFIALKDSYIQYKATNLYNKDSERCIKYDDKDINIPWSTWFDGQFIISDKDQTGKSWEKVEIF